MKIFKENERLLREVFSTSSLIEKWLSVINYDLLSDECITYDLHNGEKREGASRKEQYLSIKSKYLEKTEQYKECIICCDTALESIKRFHYNNDTWFTVRRNYSACMAFTSPEADDAIKNLIKIALAKNNWIIHYRIFECFIKLNNPKLALQYGAKALLSNDPLDKKVTLLYKYGELLQKSNFETEAIEHYALTYQIRIKFNYNISNELIQKLNECKIDKESPIDINKARRIWEKFALSYDERLSGTILSISPSGKSGFVKSDHNCNYYFRRSSFVNRVKEIREGYKVSFILIDSYDNTKKVESKEAIEIILE